jgi:shikimate dehydrogenase
MSGVLPPSAGVIGWPVAQSKSPLIHRVRLAKLGIDGDYGRFAVAPERLGDAIRSLPALGLRGVNVTVPHKQAVIDHLDAIDPGARTIGAVNCIVVRDDATLSGTNTDIDGFVEPLGTLSGAAVVVGAGGAARAVLAGLMGTGIDRVTIQNRDTAKAKALLAEFGLTGEAVPLGSPVTPAELFVNASSLGMVGQPPLDPDLSPLPDTALVYDIVYAPIETPLLRQARARGFRTIDGLAMLIGQAARAFELFFGAAPPRDHDAELRELLLR